MNHIPRYFTVSLALILIFFNILNYFSIQRNLFTNQEEKIDLIVHNIKGSVQENHDIEVSFNRFLSEDLRRTAIAIQKVLPPDADDVTSKQLALLAEQYSLKGITLFVQQGDDVVSVKANAEENVGLSAKKFVSPEWLSMLHQLLSQHNVKPIAGFGHALDNFWAAPVAQSKSNPEMVTKWGNYNDGTTNYIINIHIERNILDAYYETAGLEKKLKHFTEMNPYVLNVSIVNGAALLRGVTQKDIENSSVPNDRLFIGGYNRYPTSVDEQYALTALKSNKMIHNQAVSKEKEVLKSYYPTDLKTEGKITQNLVIVVTSDLAMLNSKLYSRIGSNMVYSTLIFLIGLGISLVSVRVINRKERTITSVQLLHKKHVDSLYETMREHRHDFNHHLHTLSGLAKMGLTDELHSYVGNLVKVHAEFNDFVDVSIPALSGLVQSKQVEAREKGIEFEYFFDEMENLDIKVEKLTDIIKIVGNILDNAFHAVIDSPKVKKRVAIYARHQNGVLKFSIRNNGAKIPDDVLTDIFKLGFTTRSTAGGTGVGLASSKKAMERYKGDITVDSTDELTTFTLSLPVKKNEVRVYSTGASLQDTPLNAE